MSENERILRLPRRNWRELPNVIEEQTEKFRTPNGSMSLRLLQAAALAEAPKVQGLFLLGRVGVGKTLLSGLLAKAFDCEDAIVLAPGKGGVAEDTEAAYKDLRAHWQIPRTIRVRSYEFLGQPQREDWLWRHPTSLIICDEGHKLRDVKNSAVAIRVSRYLREKPHVRFCFLSGSPTSHGSLLDYGHLMVAALRKHAPIPNDPRKLKQWAAALDGKGDPTVILDAWNWALAEQRFRERLDATPGVIMSSDAFDGVPLSLTTTLLAAPEETREAFTQLRKYWEAPDGWSFGDDTFQVAACARQLANGFYYRHDPRPPEEFLNIRRAWTKLCRDEIDMGRSDSEGSVKLKIQLAASEGKTTAGAAELAAWEEAAAAFPLITKADWLGLSTLQYAAKWAKPHGIIWVSHIEVGEALEQFAGIPFFHGQEGRNILEEDGSRCICASIQANGTGKNLQGPFKKGLRGGPFYHNLFLAIPANGVDMEQPIGRTHREDQEHEVTVEFVLSCREHRQALLKAIDAATKITSTLMPQKLADMPYPPNSRQDHPAWFPSMRATE